MSAPIVVVGGGLAGGTVVSELREQGHDGPITIVCDEPHPPYERPPLTKSFLRGESMAEDAYLRPAEWYADHEVTLLTGAGVQAIDPGRHRISTAAGELDYDRLVLATGCRARRLPLESTPDVGVHHLRSLADADALRTRLSADSRLLVVGGGWIGLEVAASARMLGATVTVVEPAPQPLAGTLGAAVGAWFAGLHRSHDVDLRTAPGFSGLDGSKAVLDDGDRLEVDHVVVGVGAVPVVSLARAAGLEVDNGIVVSPSLMTSAPDVLAVGDVAAHRHPLLGERIRVEHWQNALSQGKVAAKVLLGEDVVHDELPSFFSDQYDAGLEFFGHLGSAAASVGVTLEHRPDGFIARWHRDGALLATAHVNQWDESKALAQEVADAVAR